MSSKNIIGLGGKWRGAVLAAMTPALALAFASGCSKKTDDAAGIDADTVSAAGDASTEVAPPAPVVSGDPDIPLNEAVVGTTPVPADYAAETAPPEALAEDQPPKPEPTNVWIPGYWWWSRPFHRYVWVSGAWRNPPPEQTWTPGMWVSASPTRYIWMPGFWGTAGVPRSPFVEAPPPPVRIESYGAPPGEGYYWTPGYYAYRENNYVWVGGSWLRPPSVGLGWIAPTYVGIGGRYYFQPGRWDYAPEHRGTVYLPDINARAGVHVSLVAALPTVVTSHANFVVASNRAIAMGGTRTATGAIVVHGGAGVQLGGNGPHGGTEPGHAMTEPGHGGTEPGHTGTEPGHGGTEHGGAEPAHSGTEPGHGGTEHGGAEPAHSGTEPGHGGTEHGGTEPGHGGAAPHNSGELHGGNESHPGAENHGNLPHSQTTVTHGGAEPAHSGTKKPGAK